MLGACTRRWHIAEDVYYSSLVKNLSLFRNEGIWDPEKWLRSFDDERPSSPSGQSQGRERKRPTDLDRDTILKRRPSGR